MSENTSLPETRRHNLNALKSILKTALRLIWGIGIRILIIFDYF